MAKKQRKMINNKKENTNKRAASKAAQNRKKNNRKVKKVIIHIMKYTIILGIFIGMAIFFITSPIFNIKEIEINGNEKINKEEIIYLSEIKKEDNIYKYSKSAIKQKIKTNPYIENVQVYRILPDKIEINIEERKASFLLQLEGEYAYINNQGYILEKNKENIYLPIIIGFSTKVENMIEGKQLEEEDLKKLQVILNIMEAANSNQIAELITKIDIKDSNNYTLFLETESKTVYLGSEADMNMKMLYLKGLLKKEKGIAGEIFLKDEYLKNDRVFFREKV